MNFAEPLDSFPSSAVLPQVWLYCKDFSLSLNQKKFSHELFELGRKINYSKCFLFASICGQPSPTQLEIVLMMKIENFTQCVTIIDEN
jgi:hypothetical protein